jgi:2-polyprenyl-6-hydroxyphenyl methylase/3-demethylubiquinone-9 3-methyltransferase
MTAALLHDREVASRFDAAAARFKREVGASDYRLRAVLRDLAGMDCPRVLDLGCGKGRFAGWLTKQGAEVVGLDLSAGMLGEAEGFGRVRASARRLPFANGSFDALIAIEVIQHVGAVAPVVAEARRVLRPSGRILVVDRNAASLDVNRPWLPSLVIKRIDERRGLWMYPADGPVRERWLWPGRFSRILASHFEGVAVEYLLSREEAASRVFRAVPRVRRMACFSARVPGGGA